MENNINWYEIWMNQSKAFFETADQNLKGIFSDTTFSNPEEHLKQIHQWLENLKQQWEFSQLPDEQKAYHLFWQMLTNMFNEASDLMLKQWIKRTEENNPIKNIRELYELWLDCCHEIYQRSLRTKAYQDTYGEFMNSAFKFWQSALSK